MEEEDVQAWKETEVTQVLKEMLEMMVILDQREIVVNLVSQEVQVIRDHEVHLDLKQKEVIGMQVCIP